MQEKRILSQLGLVFLMLLLLLGGSILLEIGGNLQESTEPSSPAGQESDIFIDKNTMIKQDIYYIQSRRVVTEHKIADSELHGKNQKQIEDLGWNVFRGEGGQIVIFKEVNALTPEDAEKRHLKLHYGKLAVFAGPSTAQGPLLQELGINPMYLHQDWQDALGQGGIDFENNEELLTALESLDEY